jgi:hypothetical protein
LPFKLGPLFATVVLQPAEQPDKVVHEAVDGAVVLYLGEGCVHIGGLELVLLAVRIKVLPNLGINELDVAVEGCHVTLAQVHVLRAVELSFPAGLLAPCGAARAAFFY